MSKYRRGPRPDMSKLLPTSNMWRVELFDPVHSIRGNHINKANSFFTCHLY